MILKTRNMVLIGLFASFLAVCSWTAIFVPPVTMTLQTFGVLMALGILGGRRGTVSVLLYLAMGLVGLPVFAGFRGGVSSLLDATAGFLWGFLAGGLVYWGTERLGRLPAMILCQLTCYLWGCFWFFLWTGKEGVGTAVLTAVIPYLVPDAIKLWLAYRLSGRVAVQWKKME